MSNEFCPGRSWVKKTVLIVFELAVQPALHEKCFHTPAIQSLLGGCLVMVRWVLDSAVPNEIGHGGVSAVAIVKKVLEVEENTKRLPIFFTKPEMKR